MKCDRIFNLQGLFFNLCNKNMTCDRILNLQGLFSNLCNKNLMCDRIIYILQHTHEYLVLFFLLHIHIACIENNRHIHIEVVLPHPKNKKNIYL